MVFFLGSQAYIQGRFDGRCIIAITFGSDTRAISAHDLIIEEHVGWGPGAKVLGSAHTGLPIDVPIIQTDLEIKPVRIQSGPNPRNCANACDSNQAVTRLDRPRFEGAVGLSRVAVFSNLAM